MRYIFNHYDVSTRQYQQTRVADFDHLHANNDQRTLAELCYDLLPGVFGKIGNDDIMHVQVSWAGKSRPAFDVRGVVKSINYVGGVSVTNIVNNRRNNNPNSGRELQLLGNIYRYQ